MTNEATSTNLPSSKDPVHQTWMQDLDQAVAHTDEPAIWRIMDAQSQNDEAHDALASMVSRHAYERGGIPVFSEIFMMPVIADHQCRVVGDSSVWKAVSGQVRESLENWFPKTGQSVIFDGLLPMDWITTWRPGVLRNHLLKLIPEAKRVSVEFLTEEIDLPAEAPRLGFVVIGRSTRRTWPELPAVNAQMDRRLKEVVKYSLQISAPVPAGHLPHAPIVLTPERVQYAVTDGISLWLTKLHEAVGIEGWMISPSTSGLDVVKITLKLGSESVPLTQFTLRLHQIGMQGLNDIVSILVSTAPTLDKPIDI